MRHLTIAIVACFAMTLCALAEKPLKAVVVSGGCCHDYPKQKELIAEALKARMDIDVSHIGKPELKPAEAVNAIKDVLSKDGWADAYDVIIYNFCDAHQTDVDYINSVVNVHKEAGKGAVMVHCAMHSFHWKLPPGKKVSSAEDVKSKEWVQLVGVASPGHGPKVPIKVTTTDKGKGHPIMKDIPESWSTPKGELYGTPIVLDSATVLANGNNTKVDAAVIWINEYGKGKCFSITLGHHNETMQDKNWQEVFSRGVLWSTGRLK